MHADRYGVTAGKKPAYPIKLGGTAIFDVAYEAGIRFAVELHWGNGGEMAFVVPGDVEGYIQDPSK